MSAWTKLRNKVTRPLDELGKDHVVAASALTGDLYYDPLAGYAVFVIL